MDGHDVLRVLERDAVDIFSREGLVQRLLSGKALKIKLGADPSRPDLHLGHTVVLRKLRLLQEVGHEIIFVIGDFTGMIGDPSGRSKTRAPLTFKETRSNGRSYFEQVTKILDADRTRIVYNADWLGKMAFDDVLRLAGRYTLARILERDDFANRFAQNQPIGLHELLYPLMQGYDSVALAADIEVGGTDQTFNLLVGRALQKDYGQTAQEVITFPLLPGLDGVEKMSKSLDNYIGISEPADIMFEKCMKVPDGVLPVYFRLTTDLNPASYAPLLAQDIHAAHFEYAREIVRLYHGAAEAARAEQRYRAVAAGGKPESMHTLVLGGETDIITLLRSAGLAASNAEARRLIEGKGIRFQDEPIVDIHAVIGTDGVLRRGKNRFVSVRFSRV